MESEFDISIEDGLFDNGEPAIALKLSNETIEVNVQLNIDEAHSLNRVLTLPEESRALLLESAQVVRCIGGAIMKNASICSLDTMMRRGMSGLPCLRRHFLKLSAKLRSTYKISR